MVRWDLGSVADAAKENSDQQPPSAGRAERGNKTRGRGAATSTKSATTKSADAKPAKAAKAAKGAEGAEAPASTGTARGDGSQGSRRRSGRAGAATTAGEPRDSGDSGDSGSVSNTPNTIAADPAAARETIGRAPELHPRRVTITGLSRPLFKALALASAEDTIDVSVRVRAMIELWEHSRPVQAATAKRVTPASRDRERLFLKLTDDEHRLLVFARVEDRVSGATRIRALIALWHADPSFRRRVDRLAQRRSGELYRHRWTRAMLAGDDS